MGVPVSKIIAMFNHKGGVSKTTTTFNLGWALAQKGQRVLLVDSDPQCNLTGMALAFDGIDDLQGFYNTHPNANLYTAVQPIFSGVPVQLTYAQAAATKQENLLLLPGHIDLGTIEGELSMAHKLGAAVPMFQNLPGAIGHVIRATAEAYKIDIVLVDMSPSIGALNQNIFMHCDYFIVPTSPDYFCLLAISSLATTLPRWMIQAVELRRLQQTSLYKIPDRNPRFIGMISQKYRPRSGRPAQAFQGWIDAILDAVNGVLMPALSQAGMTLDHERMRAAIPNPPHVELSQIPDFNSLIAKSQECSTAVFALTDFQLNAAGAVLESFVESRNLFKRLFSSLADKVIALTA
jgi:chromosome partitioning protein